jgi:hypothetical protein
MFGNDAILVIGAKSLTGSYGSFACRFGLIECDVFAPWKIV